ncbi:Bloc-1-related complex subunit 8 homolog [Plakobranchus ocellatus]|uniref:Bloc-1-related complex subunit 8 homolog n=1 Tax=Plakobranchus ocellatus TaxID=259542 RepID=A0AAV3YME1_9GAST|nr:Bloc-1-related complex subunit 8 homolog [Plakobranchus ocellatus]
MHAGDSLYSRMATQPFYKENPADAELEHKAKKVSDKFSENVNIIANEPSLAFFRIQEHVRKTLPQLVDQKHEVEDIQEKVQGACFDAEYATNAVKAMQTSAIHFQNIQDLLKNAMFMKQQISYEENRRKTGRPSPSASAASSTQSTAGADPLMRDAQTSPDFRITSNMGQNFPQSQTNPLDIKLNADDREASQEVARLMSGTSYVSTSK